jgi:2-iminobutanoate/2-iminopropanoate deaminase
MKQNIETTKAPAAIGPYSQGTAMGSLIFVSGQLPVDPVTGAMPDTIEKQAQQAIQNLKNVLESAHSGLDKVLKTTVFLLNMNDFAAMNSVYEAAFQGFIYPARSAVEVSRLPKDAMIEIEAIAFRDQIIDDGDFE